MSKINIGVQCLYKNWKGVTAIRRLIPESIRFGRSPFHTEDQWLLLATDVDKGEKREFAMKDISDWIPIILESHPEAKGR